MFARIARLDSCSRTRHRFLCSLTVSSYLALFVGRQDLSVYETLLKELQATGCDSLFVSWHGDSHIIADDKKIGGKWKDMSPAFQRIVEQMRVYFKMDVKATRFNWYR